MFNSKKFQYGKSLSIFLHLFLLLICTLPVAAVDLPFDPNNYTFLIYESEGDILQRSIEDAMELLEISYDLRGPNNEVTANDLETHDILIVGWNSNGYTSGLHADDLAAGITGRVILSGHDADFHTVHDILAAEVFLVQAIDWVLKCDGTGLITLGCTSAFPYLPEFWDVNAYASGGEDVNEFTEEGLASGVYDDLEPNKMSGWGTSYHDIFTIGQGSLFVPFELGGSSSSDIITIACDKIKLPYFYIHKDDNDVDCVSPLISQAEHELLGTSYNWLYYNIDCNAIGYADTMFS